MKEQQLSPHDQKSHKKEILLGSLFVPSLSPAEAFVDQTDQTSLKSQDMRMVQCNHTKKEKRKKQLLQKTKQKPSLIKI